MASIHEITACLWSVSLLTYPDAIAHKDLYDTRVRFTAEDAPVASVSNGLVGECVVVDTYHIGAGMMLARLPILHLAVGVNDLLIRGVGYRGKAHPGVLAKDIVGNIPMMLDMQQKQGKPLSFDLSYLASNFPPDVVEDSRFFDRITGYLDGLEENLRRHGNP